MSDRLADRSSARPWLLAALALGAVTLVASVVPLPSPDGGGGSGVAGIGLTVPFHVVGYALLAALLGRGFGATADRFERPLVSAVAVATGYGAGIELLQATIPWRSFAVSDIVLNGVGALIGAGAVWGIARLRATPPDGTGGDRVGDGNDIDAGASDGKGTDE